MQSPDDVSLSLNQRDALEYGRRVTNHQKNETEGLTKAMHKIPMMESALLPIESFFNRSRKLTLI